MAISTTGNVGIGTTTPVSIFNIAESSAAESKKDFIHKMYVASKEAREARYWLQLISKGNIVNQNVDEELKEIDEIIRIINSIIKTTKARYNL